MILPSSLVTKDILDKPENAEWRETEHMQFLFCFLNIPLAQVIRFLLRTSEVKGGCWSFDAGTTVTSGAQVKLGLRRGLGVSIRHLLAN